MYLKGISKDLRDSTVDIMNAQYEGLRRRGESQTSTLLALVQKFPYRLIPLSSDKVTIMKKSFVIFITNDYFHFFCKHGTQMFHFLFSLFFDITFLLLFYFY